MTAIASKPSEQMWASCTQEQSRLSKTLCIQHWFSKRNSWAELCLKTSFVWKGIGPLATATSFSFMQAPSRQPYSLLANQWFVPPQNVSPQKSDRTTHAEPTQLIVLIFKLFIFLISANCFSRVYAYFLGGGGAWPEKFCYWGLMKLKREYLLLEKLGLHCISLRS